MEIVDTDRPIISVPEDTAYKRLCQNPVPFISTNVPGNIYFGELSSKGVNLFYASIAYAAPASN